VGGADPAGGDHRLARDERAGAGAGSDLAGLRTRAVLDGDTFVVNGQKVWTSGAHDADVLLTFVRTDPDAPKHQGISVLLIPTSLAGVVRRPFASICGPVVYLGPAGSGQVTKLLNNLLFTAHLATAASVLELGRALDVDAGRLAEVMNHGR
jgi:alkylation response protein AidB-like acyl-CoA dehydrogenase